LAILNLVEKITESQVLGFGANDHIVEKTINTSYKYDQNNPRKYVFNEVAHFCLIVMIRKKTNRKNIALLWLKKNYFR
jgi:hypothetical protein